MTICQQEEREAGRAYPKTCPTCRLGPCQKYGRTPLAALDALRAENKLLRTALTKINVGDGWAAQIARAALAQKGDE